MTQQATRPVSSGVQRRISYTEFLECYMGGEHVEWVDGEVVQMPAVTYTNANIAMFLASLLRFALDLKKAGVVLTEPYNMKTGPNLPGRSPDVLVVTSEHLGRIREDHLEGPADVVFEVVSESSRTVDRVEKFGEYQAGGVREYWIIDPERQTVQLFELGADAKFREVGGNIEGVYHSNVLSGIWIDARWLWSKPLPPITDVLRGWGLM